MTVSNPVMVKVCVCVCVIRGLSLTHCKNIFDWPILRIPSYHVMKKVSILHNCGPSCKFVRKNGKKREIVTIYSSTVELEHDFCKKYNFYLIFILCCNFFL